MLVPTRSVLLIVLVMSSALFLPIYTFRASIRLNSNRLALSSSAEEPCADAKCPMASKCSGEWREKGCDGSGKVQGGIATVLPWWPIKVFRPCPAYLEAGYVYRREGQTMDQVLFSEPSSRMKEKMQAATDAEAARLKEARERRELSESQETLSEEDKFLQERFGKQ